MFTEVYGTDLELPSKDFLQARQNIGLFLIQTLVIIISVNMYVALKDIFMQACGVLKGVIDKIKEKIKEKFDNKIVEKVPIETVQILEQK
jgi:hypothetical protein